MHACMYTRAILSWVFVFEGIHIVFELEHSTRGVGPHYRMEIDGTGKRCGPMCRIAPICLRVVHACEGTQQQQSTDEKASVSLADRVRFSLADRVTLSCSFALLLFLIRALAISHSRSFSFSFVL